MAPTQGVAAHCPSLAPTPPLLERLASAIQRRLRREAALDGWIADETPEKIRNRAAAAYAKYQKISVNAAQRLFSTGW
jgi:hypothetical protein